jgi:hypothetical protein
MEVLRVDESPRLIGRGLVSKLDHCPRVDKSSIEAQGLFGWWMYSQIGLVRFL